MLAVHLWVVLWYEIFSLSLQIKSISLTHLNTGNFSMQEFGAFFIPLFHLVTFSTSRVLLGLSGHRYPPEEILTTAQACYRHHAVTLIRTTENQKNLTSISDLWKEFPYLPVYWGKKCTQDQNGAVKTSPPPCQGQQQPTPVQLCTFKLAGWKLLQQSSKEFSTQLTELLAYIYNTPSKAPETGRQLSKGQWDDSNNRIELNFISFLGKAWKNWNRTLIN